MHMSIKKPEFNIELPLSSIQVTNEDIDDIMHTVMEGCAYWCAKSEPVGDYLGDYASDQISRGGILKFYPMAEDGSIEDPVELNKEKFRKGLYKWLLSLGNDGRMMKGGWIDPGCIDASDADSILQYALFDELIYS